MGIAMPLRAQAAGSAAAPDNAMSQPSSQPSSQSSMLSSPDSLTIGGGDLLTVHVLEAPDLDQRGRVTDDGRFPLILGGNVQVRGLTPDQAARVIEQALVSGSYMLSPHVSVGVEQFAARGVTVIGQVKNSGTFPINTARTVLDALALAGGLTELADHKVTIQRRTTGEQIPYLVSNRADILLKDQPLVYPGDTVFVPKTYVVYILGDVFKPGGYAAATNDNTLSALQALALAGGTPPTAVPSRARLVRKTSNGGYMESAIQLSAMQKGKQPDFVLKPDDIIFVPYSYLKNIAVSAGQIVAAGTSAAIYTH